MEAMIQAIRSRMKEKVKLPALDTAASVTEKNTEGFIIIKDWVILEQAVEFSLCPTFYCCFFDLEVGLRLLVQPTYSTAIEICWHERWRILKIIKVI